MIDFFKTLFGLRSNSGETAKERLRLVLLSDHLSLEPDLVDSLKADLLEVIARYVDIDATNADITFEHRDREIAMLASVPVTGVRKSGPAVQPARLSVVPPAPPAAPEPSPAVTPVQAVAPPSQAVPAVSDEAPSAEPSAAQPPLTRPARRRRRRRPGSGLPPQQAAPPASPPSIAEA